MASLFGALLAISEWTIVFRALVRDHTNLPSNDAKCHITDPV